MSEVEATPEEPVWRQRARLAALAVLALTLCLQFVLPPVQPALLLGTVIALGALAFGRPLGIAIVGVRAILELADSLATLHELGLLAAAFQALGALGLGALAWVLYRMSPDASQERLWTLSGIAAVTVGTLGFVAVALGPLMLDPENEPGLATQLTGHQAAYSIALPTGEWRVRRRAVSEAAGLDAWAVGERAGVRTDEEFSVLLRMGLPMGEEGLEMLAEYGEDDAYREVVREAHRWLLHAQQVTPRGPAAMTCVLTNEHGVGMRACAFAASGATSERVTELQAALATLRLE